MSELASVAVKLPIFWTTSPSAWFAQAEAQFTIRKITEDATKYYVVAALDTDIAIRALFIITAPPPTEKFEAIKTFLTSAYEFTDSEHATTLFSLHGLGDYKPTEQMDSMLALLVNIVHASCLSIYSCNNYRITSMPH